MFKATHKRKPSVDIYGFRGLVSRVTSKDIMAGTAERSHLDSQAGSREDLTVYLQGHTSSNKDTPLFNPFLLFHQLQTKWTTIQAYAACSHSNTIGGKEFSLETAHH
ncbi:mCG146823 [Mus musculus]|jgi:hypothetical protein|nr:mCG146823 [Mus musculus]